VSNDTETIKGSIQSKNPVAVTNTTRLPQKISFKDQLQSEMTDFKSQLNIVEAPRTDFDAKTNKTLLSSKKSSFVAHDVKAQQLMG
jgi:predicted acyltransferase (DUF342 family)